MARGLKNLSFNTAVGICAGIVLVFCLGLYIALTAQSLPWTAEGLFICTLAFFHFVEFFHSVKYNPELVAIESFLLHNPYYWIAMITCQIEHFTEMYYDCSWKHSYPLFYIGVLLVVGGEVIRKIGMWTLRSGFTHQIMRKKRQNHILVTHGILQYTRHPAYFGWFLWSVGTQCLLCNPISIVTYTIVSWVFMARRIPFEEKALISLFGTQYEEYRRRVPTLIPFIK